VRKTSNSAAWLIVELREMAEKRVSKNRSVATFKTAEELEHLVYELTVHQEELEIQNEELRRIQLDLQASRDRFADLYDFAPIGYLSLDTEGIVVEANLKAAAMLGVNRSKLIGTRLAMYCDLDSRTALRSYLDAILADGKPQSCELNFKSESKFYAYLEGRRVASDDGGGPRCLVVISDITEQKQAEEELRIRDRCFAAETNGIVITDVTQPDNPIVYCNPAFERITGYSKDEIIGRNCRFLQGEDRDQPQRRLIREAIEQGRDVTVVLRNFRKDGTLFWNELRIAPVRDDRGELTHFVGIQNDITERVLAEQALIEKDQYLRSLADSLTMLIGYLDMELRFQSCNAAYAEWFGLSPEDLKGQSIRKVLGDNFVSEIEGQLSDAMNGRRADFESPLTHQHMGRRDMHIMLVPDAGADGKVKGLHCLCIDITDRKVIDEQNGRRRKFAERLSRLDAAENDVYKMIIRGMSNKTIAYELDIGLRTAERRRHVILEKLEVESLAELLQQLSDIQGIQPLD
jgi:PAS domain S-box-containing protein